MSEISLSLPPPDSEHDTLQLPTLIPLRRLQRGPELPESNSILFVKGLFRRTLLEFNPIKIQYQCLQDDCNYAPSRLIKDTTTTNL